MDGVPLYRGVEVFGLQGLPRAIELDDEGLHHPRSARSSVRVFTPYADFTHLASSARTLWLGTRRSTYVLPRRAFVDPNGPENLVRALLTRIARSPGGGAQLARMAQIEEAARARFPLRAVWGLVAACLVVFVAQLAVGLPVREVGYFSPLLVLDGDLWRIVTANLVHAGPRFPLHLVLNLLALLALGFVVERPLGSARTFCVIAASGAGAMWVSAFVENQPVVGASGVVFGLAGGALWLELRCADQLPAWWRLPRRLFGVLLGLNAALPALLWLLGIPLIAWGAHLGGFAAGLATTALLCGRRLPARAPSPRWLRAAAAGVVAVGVLAVAIAARELATSDDFVAAQAARLAALPGIDAEELNEYAWMIAIRPERSEAQIEAALLLAERAVVETGRSRAHILDTLAEVQFQMGWSERALATIDEAIAQEPDEAYYQEQRRRFLGERDAGDRPQGPTPWGDPAPSPEGDSTA
jgi:membrane associated rhomboid family serine protease